MARNKKSAALARKKIMWAKVDVIAKTKDGELGIITGKTNKRLDLWFADGTTSTVKATSVAAAEPSDARYEQLRNAKAEQDDKFWEQIEQQAASNTEPPATPDERAHSVSWLIAIERAYQTVTRESMSTQRSGRKQRLPRGHQLLVYKKWRRRVPVGVPVTDPVADEPDETDQEVAMYSAQNLSEGKHRPKKPRLAMVAQPCDIETPGYRHAEMRG